MPFEGKRMPFGGLVPVIEPVGVTTISTVRESENERRQSHLLPRSKAADEN
jgi:hypothetical protein